ncbi:hypothetical protein [Bacillus chungangensis]|uniref:Uncharacterized protein n=1 Tax=Bacillus chungangensis TaxID=587633 RepID=A0ABT9WTZ6_9BACI|nr:hypothetical protein [Bacillus chungangensis]MDQ0176767.1 hypothetical protein [Bacillus chungangensis]
MKKSILKTFIITNLLAISLVTSAGLLSNGVGLFSKADFGFIMAKSKADFGSISTSSKADFG